MKNLLLSTFIIMMASPVFCQESLIASIMNVDPVNITIGEEEQKKVDEYDANYSEATTKLDEELTKLGENYASGVTDLIEKFTGVMDKGDEQGIKNEKQRVKTMANSLTFNLIKDKKAAIQRFKNNLVVPIRNLPKPISKMKEKEMEDMVSDYKEKIHQEFEANQRVLRQFQATEHIQKTHISDVTPTTDSDG